MRISDAGECTSSVRIMSENKGRKYDKAGSSSGVWHEACQRKIITRLLAWITTRYFMTIERSAKNKLALTQPFPQVFHWA